VQGAEAITPAFYAGTSRKRVVLESVSCGDGNFRPRKAGRPWSAVRRRIPQDSRAQHVFDGLNERLRAADEVLGVLGRERGKRLAVGADAFFAELGEGPSFCFS
jgi:hypothetical protein